MSNISVSEIIIYPVKSFAGLSLGSAKLDLFGLADDRRWMLVDEFGVAITQRSEPKLALIEAELCSHGLCLRLSGDSLAVHVPDPGDNSCSVKVWSDTVVAADAGEEAALWFSARLGTKCRLVYMPQNSKRLVDDNYARRGETVGFADAFPVLLISQASLDDLNSRLETPVPMNRFRPNLVVSGCEAFAEDSWRRIRVGEVEFQLAKPCDRCVMPSIDQATGEKDKNINRVLASYRRRDGKIYFGQNLLYRETGIIRLSSPVEVLE